MASKHRKSTRAAGRIATLGVATATVTALVAGAAPPPQANAAATVGSPGLPSMQLAPGALDPASIPDLSFGLGPQGYNLFQSLGAALELAILNNVNLSGVLQNLGYDPEAAINTALGNALVNALTGVTVDTGSIPVLGPILQSAQITNVAALLDLLGFNLADPLNLNGVATPGVNLITAGPPFALLKFLGVDLGFVPGFPNSVADEINGTPYLGISPVDVLEKLKMSSLLSIGEKGVLDGLITSVTLLLGDADVIDVRVPVVLGFGLGAFAAGMAYPQVVADLPNQPGGANYTGDGPLAGSLTILPLILLRNPGRANGGLLARGYPLAGLLGIDTVTPDTEVSSSSDGTGLNIPVGTTGIVLGGANLIPIKVDATVEYDALSDVPAWPNPFSLANSAAALLFPTYLLRGITAASLTEVVANQLTPQLAAALGSSPLALNLYLTVPVNNALPLLEPVKLPIDLINLFTGANLNNPIATALEPALTTLVNLGYTDVKRTVVDGVPVYDRTLDQANVITPFGTLPSGIDFGQVPGDLLVQLVAGIQKAIAQGFVGSPGVNPLAILANLLGLNGLPGSANSVSPLSALTALGAVTDLPGLTGDTVNAAALAEAPAAISQKPAPSAAKLSADTDLDAAVTLVGGTAPETTVAPEVTAQTDEVAVVIPEVTAQPDKPVKPAATSAQASAKRAQDRADASFKRAADRLDKIAKDGNEQIQKVVKDFQDGVQKTVKTVSGADKPAEKSIDKSSDNAAS